MRIARVIKHCLASSGLLRVGSGARELGHAWRTTYWLCQATISWNRFRRVARRDVASATVAPFDAIASILNNIIIRQWVGWRAALPLRLDLQCRRHFLLKGIPFLFPIRVFDFVFDPKKKISTSSGSYSLYIKFSLTINQILLWMMKQKH